MKHGIEVKWARETEQENFIDFNDGNDYERMEQDYLYDIYLERLEEEKENPDID